MSEEYNQGYSYDSNETEPQKPRKKRKVWKGIAIALSVVLVLGLIGGGSYVAFSRVKDYLEAREAAKEEKNHSPANLTQADSGSSVATTNTGTIMMMDVSDVVSEIKPSVVQVTNEILYTMNFAGQQASQSEPSAGSGVIISENDSELLIVTNHHVVDAGEGNGLYSASSAGISVQFIDGSTADAVVKGTDEEADLAVLSVNLADLSEETISQIKIATIGSSDDLKEGQGVIAIGNALGYGLSVTVGYVSALNREVTVNGNTNQYIQTDAAINPGNSGGGLFNTKGELIGINDAKTVDESVEGIGYAIPISSVGDIITDLMNQVPRVPVSENEKGYLGISGQDIDASTSQLYNLPKGVLITYIQEGSAAEKAGLKLRDIITAVNGTSVDSFEEIRTEISYCAAGDEMELTVQRLIDGEYQEQTLTAVLGSYAEEAPEGGTVPNTENGK